MSSMGTTEKIKHLANLMHAAIPYTNGKSRAHMETFIKASEFMDSFHQTSSMELSACDLSNEPINYEALLQSLQPMCTNKELDLVNTILNFYKTQKIIQTYQSMKDFLPASESNNFNLQKILPLIENFLENHNSLES